MDSDYEQESEEIIGIMVDSSDDDSSTESQDETTQFWRSTVHQHDDIYLESRRNYIMSQMERISEVEQPFLDSDKQSGRYYIGSTILIRKRYYIMNAAITAASFFQFPIQSIMFYLSEVSMVYFTKPRIEIMRLYIHPVTMEYIVVLKTFWLCIVQRRWRRILRERAEVLRKRCCLQNLQHRMVYGRHLHGLNVLPGLVGMIQN